MSTGLIGSTNIAYGGTSTSASSSSGGDGSSAVPFSVQLDATGQGVFALSNADTYKVGGLSFNGIPSLSYAPPYREDLSNTDEIVIRVADFSDADEDLEVAGFYWV